MGWGVVNIRQASNNSPPRRAENPREIIESCDIARDSASFQERVDGINYRMQNGKQYCSSGGKWCVTAGTEVRR